MTTRSLLHGDCRAILRTLLPGSVQCMVTSPPYFGLRRYSDDEREIGGEPTPAEYVAHLVEVFDTAWDVLADDGTLWLNLGDSYANDTKWGGRTSGKHAAGLQGSNSIGRNDQFEHGQQRADRKAAWRGSQES
jgi:DNA modification methylase